MYDIEALVRVTAAGAAVASRGIAVARSIVGDLASAAKWLRRVDQSGENVRKAKSLLGIDQPRVSYRSDNAHPLYRESPDLHPDNRMALATVAGDDYATAHSAGRSETVDIANGSLGDNLVLVGSPTAEGVSRLAFGYEPVLGVDDSLVLVDAPVDLPYWFVIDRDQVPDGATAARLVPGRGRVVRPNWRVTSPRSVFIPEVDNDGWLTTDYLVVTRLRNFLAPDAWAGGRTLVSIGGTHGTGTRAARLVMKDRALLRAISEQVGSATCFQALFRVSDFRHNKRLGTYARRIELVEDVQTLDDNDERWRTAERLVASRVADWARQRP